MHCPTCPPPTNSAPIVSGTSKNWETAMDLSILGVPQARGVGHKAISQWLLASSAICSNYSALSKVCVEESFVQRLYKKRQWNVISFRRYKGTREEGWGRVPGRHREVEGLDLSGTSPLSSLGTWTQRDDGARLPEAECTQMPLRFLCVCTFSTPASCSDRSLPRSTSLWWNSPTGKDSIRKSSMAWTFLTN